MSTFVEVPAELIRSALTKAGFCLDEPAGNEEVWVRMHEKTNDYRIRVYTSLSVGAAETRDCGTDAIRVAVVERSPWVWPARWAGCWKSKRVHRTGSPEKVVERMLERAREAYGYINSQLKNTQAQTSKQESR